MQRQESALSTARCGSNASQKKLGQLCPQSFFGGLQFAQCLTSDLDLFPGLPTHSTGTAKVPFPASSASSCLFFRGRLEDDKCPDCHQASGVSVTGGIRVAAPTDRLSGWVGGLRS